jgi:hypothetical protein
MKSFDIFSIESIPIKENSMEDALVISASTLQPCEEILPYKLEVNFRPLVPDNLEHWKVFDDENKIMRFLQNEGEYLETQKSYSRKRVTSMS